jgi:dTDP-4-amino-4,6-dideoxygalactose transaminase
MNEFYKNLFGSIPGVEVFNEPNKNYFCNNWLSIVSIDKSKTNGISSEDLRLCLEKENIESRPLWKPMHMQPVFAGAPFYGCGVAEEFFENGLCLPSGSNLTDDDRNRIASSIKNCFKS